MMSILLLLTSLVFFLVLTERIDVGLVYNGKLTITIQFNVFALMLTNEQNQAHPKKKRRMSFKFFGPALELFSTVLNRSEIILNGITLPAYNASAASLPLLWSARLSIISTILSFIENEAKKFSAQNITLPLSAHNNFELDITLKISLLKLIAPIMKFSVAIIGIELKKYRGGFAKWQKTR